jgi:hypothetical protein
LYRLPGAPTTEVFHIVSGLSPIDEAALARARVEVQGRLRGRQEGQDIRSTDVQTIRLRFGVINDVCRRLFAADGDATASEGAEDDAAVSDCGVELGDDMTDEEEGEEKKGAEKKESKGVAGNEKIKGDMAGTQMDVPKTPKAGTNTGNDTPHTRGKRGKEDMSTPSPSETTTAVSAKRAKPVGR